MNIKLFVTLCLVNLFVLVDSRAAVTLPDVINSHMVLQRHQPVPIWGKASPREKITVTFLGQTKSTSTQPDGHWSITLDPLETNTTPSVMTITGVNTTELTDILVGEVWLCTGQSNMQWTLAQSDGGEAAIANANHPTIRLFNVSRDVAFKRKKGALAQWATCTPETVRDFSGVGYFFGVDLQKELDNVPIGLINSSYGGSQAEAWTPRSYLAASPDLQPCIDREKIWAAERPQVQANFDRAIAEWEKAVEKAKASGEKTPRKPRVPDALRDYRIAASIYEGMIEPLMPFAIKGALWYQGESNEERAEQYELLLPTMIRSWREGWGQGDLPFAIVQLPNFRKSSETPEDKAWSHIRDAQRKTFLNTPNTGLIVTIDIGEADDIHPRNKLDVGLRLSRWAQAEAYGKKITPSGPIFREVSFKKGKAFLSFDEVGRGLKTCDDDELHEFAIAGEDQQWHWAKAKIKGKKKIVVWSEEVENPVALRYAFNNNPVQPNLSNETCIPATPFRTDDWPGPTAGKR